LETVLFEVEAGVRFVIKEVTVCGGEAVKRSIGKPKEPLSGHMLLRLAAAKT
jgi:hypothetical protein